jgi:hypothetical protein
MRITLLFAAVLMPFAGVASARADEIATQVAKARASLDEAADAAFIEVWPEFAKSANELGITASAVRRWTRWEMAGFSLGICRSYSSSTLKADWYSAFDRLSFDGELRDHLRERGEVEVAEGEKSELLAALTTREKAKYCQIELEAIREVLNEV